ncbi:Oidioi.mRNA.OKI2018_I69.PAR.g11581.t1.cds [Oikopleura dioica]|uniref:Dipeptidase n=1 Tax=Oikopleura dioica TaxID=34765 RepID=A0ABN7RWC7_OIKDI|nr:Oidioi.mRNA.OKI2018_I69.PAR.g11581.t1.cds [Oikopleura dioica]
MKLFEFVALGCVSARFVDVIDTHEILPLERFARKKAGVRKEKPDCIKDYQSPSADALQKANRYLEGHGVFDGHNDLPMTYTYLTPKNQDLSKINLYEREPPGQSDPNIWPQNSQTTIPLAKEGQLRAQFWSIYWGCSSNGKDAVLWALEQIDVAKRMIEKHDEFIVPKTANEAEALIRDAKYRKGYRKRERTILGCGHMIGESLAVLRQFYDLGVRYMTLTHSCDLPWVTSSNADSKTDVGLSEFGVKVVQEMNRMGMIVDLSHVSSQTMRDALGNVTAPVMFSHSSARAIADHPRNVPDDVLQMVKTNNGVVMVVFYAGFVKRGAVEYDEDGNTVNICITADDVVDHMMHIGELIGWDHVGIGADYNGAEDFLLTQKERSNVSSYPLVFGKLIERLEKLPQYAEAEIESIVQRIASDNILRVWKDVEEEAQKLQNEKEPDWSWIPETDRTWDESNSYTCKSGRDWPEEGEEKDEGNSAFSKSAGVFTFVFALFLINF